MKYLFTQTLSCLMMLGHVYVSSFTPIRSRTFQKGDLLIHSGSDFTSRRTYVSRMSYKSQQQQQQQQLSKQLYKRMIESKKTSLNLFFQSKEEDQKTMEKNSGNVAIVNEERNEKEGYMGDLVKLLKREEDMDTTIIEKDDFNDINDVEEDQSLGNIIASASFVFIAAAIIAINSMGISVPEVSVILSNIQSFFADPNTVLEGVVDKVESMGALGFFYFGAAYTIAEILAIPAIPLTASAGYLFGVRDGTIVVLISASIAAAVSFVIGRTFLRKYVEKALENYPDFKKIDRAVGEEGFKLMLLLRVSPIFPFALSNYFYGATRIGFWAFFFGTMIGFTPGTIAYVYTGEIGKSLTLDAGSEPWYVYVGLLALFSGFLKIIADVATGIIEKIDDFDEE